MAYRWLDHLQSDEFELLILTAFAGALARVAWGSTEFIWEQTAWAPVTARIIWCLGPSYLFLWLGARSTQRRADRWVSTGRVEAAAMREGVLDALTLIGLIIGLAALAWPLLLTLHPDLF